MNFQIKVRQDDDTWIERRMTLVELVGDKLCWLAFRTFDLDHLLYPYEIDLDMDSEHYPRQPFPSRVLCFVAGQVLNIGGHMLAGYGIRNWWRCTRAGS